MTSARDSLMLDEPSFRALARSSPWRWATLRFVHNEQWPSRPDVTPSPVRAWLRRPDRLRVEDSRTGELVQIVHEGPDGGVWLTADGGRPRSPRLARAPAPAYRADGLVETRPRVDTDAPMFNNYQWVAMLDPVELSDGRGQAGERRPEGTVLSELSAVTHHGRPAWEAVVVPTAEYAPRCSCCPLLLHTETAMPPPPDTLRPDAHRVRLDVETGVCVYVEEIGGTHRGWTLDVRIEAVDEPMEDELFERRRRWFAR